LAFPPDYTTAGYFYVYYSNKDGNNVLSRFYLSADHNIADPNSEEQILVIPHPTYGNHNGDQLAFGPDGMMYIAVGDGGGRVSAFLGISTAGRSGSCSKMGMHGTTSCELTQHYGSAYWAKMNRVNLYLADMVGGGIYRLSKAISTSLPLITK
jgi:hypothetical protein